MSVSLAISRTQDALAAVRQATITASTGQSPGPYGALADRLVNRIEAARDEIDAVPGPQTPRLRQAYDILTQLRTLADQLRAGALMPPAIAGLGQIPLAPAAAFVMAGRAGGPIGPTTARGLQVATKGSLTTRSAGAALSSLLPALTQVIQLLRAERDERKRRVLQQGQGPVAGIGNYLWSGDV